MSVLLEDTLHYIAGNQKTTFIANVIKRKKKKQYDFVQPVILKQEFVDAMEEQLATNNVISVMIIAAGGVMAFAVLYSLVDMNFYERIRDLATLSVFGFFPKEIQRLILSENMIFTILDIGFGTF